MANMVCCLHELRMRAGGQAADGSRGRGGGPTQGANGNGGFTHKFF